MDDLYLDSILDRYKHPLFSGWIEVVPENYSLDIKQAHNVSCGDKFEVTLLRKDNIVVDAKWRGEGCAISTASTDLFCEWAIGKTTEQLHGFDQKQIQELTGIESITPAREKCLYLPISLKA
ncbi:MAG: iron-sulfur cluster assembly scaffold protein [Candidatus Woesebacteria bacterium]